MAGAAFREATAEVSAGDRIRRAAAILEAAVVVDPTAGAAADIIDK